MLVVVPLVPAAVQLLKRRQQKNINGRPWVFPCRTKNGTHLKEANAAWIRIMARAGLQDKHIHDLRRTHGTWLVNQGASLEVIAKALGHASLSATKIYARLSLEAVRESVERATQSLLQLLEGPANDQT